MGTNFIYNRTNINGLPCIESRSITEPTTSVLLILVLVYILVLDFLVSL